MPGGCSRSPNLFFLGKGSGEVNGIEPLGSQGSGPSWCQGRSNFPRSAQFQALGTWEEHLFWGGHHRTRKPLLQVRHMHKWFPGSGSWSWNWKRQVEVPLPPRSPVLRLRVKQRRKTTSSAEWRSKRGGFKSTMRQFGKLKFRISRAGLYIRAYGLL